MHAWDFRGLRKRRFPLSEAHHHRLEGTAERIEHEAERFQRDSSQQGVVARFTQDDGTVAFFAGQRELTFGNAPFNFCAVGQRECNCPLRLEL